MRVKRTQKSRVKGGEISLRGTGLLDEDEFYPHQVTLSSGEQTEFKLAERGHCLSNGLWVREIRKLTQKGHQTSIIGTDYRSDIIPLVVAMFARWSQENFFKYCREHFGLDKLVDYCTEPVSSPQRWSTRNTVNWIAK